MKTQLPQGVRAQYVHYLVSLSGDSSGPLLSFSAFLPIELETGEREEEVMGLGLIILHAGPSFFDDIALFRTRRLFYFYRDEDHLFNSGEKWPDTGA